MRKIISAVIAIIVISLFVSVSASAAEVQTLKAENVDEEMLKHAFAMAVNNDAESIKIEVSRDISENEHKNLVAMLGNIQNLWSYRAPETYNYTRNTAIRTVSRAGSFDVEIILGNSYGLDIQTAHEQKRLAESKAAEIWTSLVADGMVSSDASETEIARVVLDYICANVTYINDDTDLCHTAYSAFFNNYAVCDGYTSAYNLILKQAGITCYGIKGWAGGCHEWTAAVLDGSLVYIDSTWCDNNDNDIDLSYFAIAPDKMSDHTAYYI